MHLTVQQLSSTLDGALTGPSLELVVRHLAACHECRDRQARLAKHDDALRRLLAQDPDDMFLDDLTRRTEAIVIALSRGLPPPVMVTSVPLLHEEDPYAPAEPPPSPPRPEFGRSGELAKEAGYGRIGAKPSSSPQAPSSDPAEAQRLLDALAGGAGGDFTELTAEGLRDHGQVDGPVFDLPEWIKAHNKAAPKVKGPREVHKIDLFFEQLNAELANLPPDAVDEVFRREDEPAPARPDESALGAVPLVEPASRESNAPWDASPVEPAPASWGVAGFEPTSLDPSMDVEPVAPPFAMYAREVPGSRPRVRRPRGHDGALVLALTSVAGLAAIVLTLQLFPATPDRPGRDGPTAGTGLELPRVEFVRHDSAESESERPVSEVRNASVPPPLEQVLPSEQDTDSASEVVPADSPAGTRADAPVPAATRTLHREPSRDEDVTPPARRTGASRADASRQRPASAPASTRPAPAPRLTATPATSTPAMDESEWPLVCGLVEDADGLPVPGARVSVAELSFAIRTDTRGRFCLSAPPGPHTLLIEAAGRAAQREDATFTAGAADLRIRLGR